MRSFLVLLLSFICVHSFAQEVTLSGTITDERGKPVPFATVYIKNTSKGTSANSEGGYSISLKTGQYQVQYRAISYRQESRDINLTANQVVNISLKPADYQLKEVTIRAGGEDPAYAIIRQAIKKRKFHLNEVEAYSCEIYIKGLQKLLAAPKKFLGFDVQRAARENGLDSNRTGIVYLSESQSKYSFIRPDKVHEEVISSKVSGSNRAFTFNRASDLRVNFYENFQNWEGLSNRPLVSPIADNALFYYKYKYIGTIIENGETINKIQVTPRREHDPCFSGYVYILEDSWRLQGLELAITKKSNINFVDTLKVDQEFFPVNSKVWMPSSIKFEFTGGLFGFKVGGYFISVYKDYDLNPSFNKTNFAEVLRINRGVNKKDSAYWQQERPIPLTAEEVTDYQKKAVLAAKRESKPYLDSIDKVHNKASITKLLLYGYNHRNRYDHEYYNFNSVVNSIFFNTVQGLAIDYGGTFLKQIDTVNNRYFAASAKVGYGFANKLLYGSAGVSVPVSNFALGINGGSDIIDQNNRSPITRLNNTFYSLLRRENVQKLYQKQYLRVDLSGRVSGGWLANAWTEYADRKWLANATDYSFAGHDNREYTSNNPLTPQVDAPLFPQNQSFKLGLRTTYNFSNKYETYPTGRRYLPSEYPTIGFSVVKALKNVLGSDADYTLLSADISKNDIPLGFYGKTSFSISAGKFFNASNISYVDYRHFAGGQTLFNRRGINDFMMLDFYTYSTGDKYLEGHLEHNLSGFIVNKIPLIRNLKLQEIIDVNYLYTPERKNYTEVGFGFQNNTGFRIMYGMSFGQGNKLNSAIRIGIGL